VLAARNADPVAAGGVDETVGALKVLRRGADVGEIVADAISELLQR